MKTTIEHFSFYIQLILMFLVIFITYKLHRLLNMAKHNRKRNVPDMGDGKKVNSPRSEDTTDKSPIVYQRGKLSRPLNISKRPLTDRQKEFLELVLDKKCKLMFISGPAGSSKTYMAIYAGLTLMSEKRVSDIIYVRSAVESSDYSLGFLPGEMKDKLSPYLQPLEEKIEELLPKDDISILKKEDRLIPMPIGFVRGASWNAKCIIADESQNFSKKEILTLISRVGEFSKLLVCADPEQSDINGKSGFIPMMNHFNDEESRSNGIYTFEFTEEDIVRSALVKFIIGKMKTYPN